MPQEKGMYRPRIVDTTPITPAFNPTEPPPIDVVTLIQSLMNPTPQPAPPPMGVQDRIGGILQAVASGIGTGISNDPGQALLGQIQQIKAQKFAKEQQEKEQRDSLDRMNRQFGMQLLNNQVGEQADIRKEKRTEQYKAADREANFDLYLKKNAIEYQQDQETNKQKREYQKADMILQHQWDIEKQDKVDSRFQQTQERLENKDLFDKKISLISAGIPAGMANAIANKMFKGEDLSPTEAKTITAAAQKALRVSRGTGGGGSGGGISGLTDKQKQSFYLSRMKDNFVVVEMPDGTEATVEMSNAPKDMMGNITGFKRIATDGDKMRKISSEIDAYDLLRGNKPTTAPTAKIPVAISNQAKWDSTIKGMLKDGDTPAMIEAEVQSFIKNNPNMPIDELQAIQNAMVANKLAGQEKQKQQGFLDRMLRKGIGGAAGPIGSYIWGEKK